MQRTSTDEIQSQVAPGVTFTIRKISYGRRGEIREILTKLTHGVDEKDFPAMARAGNLTDRQSYDLMLKSIKGLDIDGVEATPATQYQDGDPSLTEEILKAISKEMGIGDTEAKNSPASFEASSPEGADLN